MTAPNRNTLWAETFVDELVAAGIEAACVAPGSRSTPLVVALAAHPEIRIYSHFDERSAASFALGRGRRGEPTAVVTTSGTATANLHPAAMEADRGRVPLLLLTADRPPELGDSGANQTVDQEKLYGDAVRWYRDVAEPESDARKLRSLRTTAARAVAEATGTPAGPVHLNVRFRKPLEPLEVPGDVPEDFPERAPLGAEGRAGPYVRTTRGRPTLDPDDLETVAAALADAERPLVVAGPADPPIDGPSIPRSLADLARRTGAPLLADPLSGLRFGPHVPDAPVVGGYDAYLGGAGDRSAGPTLAVEEWPAPDVVVRVGASPTSKPLRHYLRDVDARQFLVDPAGGWREAEFTATDLVASDPERLISGLLDRLDGNAEEAAAAWRTRFARADESHWDLVEGRAGTHFEGGLLSDVAALAPDPATVFVSNSMPVRDLDRFGRPREADLTVLGNRGVSGIDGVTSSALGAGSATDDPLVLVTGDLAYYHDMNGLLALDRCGVDATVVLLNNDGGGIFHKLPIEEFDPPFTEQFKTPHGLDFAPTGDLYDLDFERVEDREQFRERFETVVDGGGTQVLEVQTDAEESHRERDRLAADLRDRLRE
ncbi:2-succinyl-5-enolpyruvyl-6-hydroxy-3-cyclohexene-1-carboxylic-acid synthase [Halobacteriales archaeon QS_1_68_20]|nr:MAG: 2-succinyl-5-enolpyruvyl-6-hydroxy-3-cyclohexene-1-carboxylic-acid synthase [Halobacteriales archaeon QS_1_68_20]